MDTSMDEENKVQQSMTVEPLIPYEHKEPKLMNSEETEIENARIMKLLEAQALAARDPNDPNLLEEWDDTMEECPRYVTHTRQSYEHPFLCHYCGSTVPSKIFVENGTFAWIMSFVIAMFGGFCGCCLCPFHTHCAKDVYHRCGNCEQLITVKKNCWCLSGHDPNETDEEYMYGKKHDSDSD